MSIEEYVRKNIDWDWDFAEPEDWYGNGNFDDAYQVGVRDGEQDVLHILATNLGITQ